MAPIPIQGPRRYSHPMQSEIIFLPTPTLSPQNHHDLADHLQKSEIFREYQKAFQTTTGLPLAIRAAGSFQAPMHGSKKINPFCGLMAGRNKTCSACLQLQQRIESELQRGGHDPGVLRGPERLECAGAGRRAGGRVPADRPGAPAQALVPPVSSRSQRRSRTWARSRRRPQLKEAYFQTRRDRPATSTTPSCACSASSPSTSRPSATSSW